MPLSKSLNLMFSSRIFPVVSVQWVAFVEKMWLLIISVRKAWFYKRVKNHWTCINIVASKMQYLSHCSLSYPELEMRPWLIWFSARNVTTYFRSSSVFCFFFPSIFLPKWIQYSVIHWLPLSVVFLLVHREPDAISEPC